MAEITKKMYANIGKLITSSLDIDEILEGVMKEVKLFFNPEHWSLLRLDENTNELYFLFMEGVKTDSLDRIRLQEGEGIAGSVIETGEPIFTADVTKDDRFTDKVDKIIGFETRSIIAVPMKYRNRIYGVIEIVNSMDSRKFDEEDLMILSTIADFTAISLANSSLYRKTIEQTNHDSLTGLFNRRKLEDLISKSKEKNELSRRTADTKSLIKLIYIDVNDFKNINDTLGHREGDRVLTSIAEMLSNIFRSEDMLFRVGGDEFIAVIKMSDTEVPDLLEKRITEKLTELKYTTKKKNMEVSVSFGTATGKLENLHKLIDEADRKMYELKIKSKEQ